MSEFDFLINTPQILKCSNLVKESAVEIGGWIESRVDS